MFAVLVFRIDRSSLIRVVDALCQETEIFRRRRSELQERVAELRRQLTEAETAEREMTSRIVVNERRENALLRREDTMLQEIEAAESHRSFFNDASSIGFPDGLVIDLAGVQDCDDLLRWDPGSVDTGEGGVHNLPNS